MANGVETWVHDTAKSHVWNLYTYTIQKQNLRDLCIFFNLMVAKLQNEIKYSFHKLGTDQI